MRKFITALFVIITFGFVSCEQKEPKDSKDTTEKNLKQKIKQYEIVELTADLSRLTKCEQRILPLLFEAAGIIDGIFWQQSFGDKESLMDLLECPYAREYALLNYGPWGRLEGHTSFHEAFQDKFPGANFYPSDMTREEFEQWEDEAKYSPYTLIRRTPEGTLTAIPYAEAFKEETVEISGILKKAASLSDNKSLANYLRQLASAFLKNDFTESDIAWMEMKDNNLDVIMRPLDNGEDRKFGFKAAHTSYIVVKDKEWSEKLARFSGMIHELHASLPVPDTYKQEAPGEVSEIFVYDAIYYAGHCNAGPKIIALHMPQDSDVQQVAGTRSMQFRNVMEAKFDYILKPIGDIIIHEDQRALVDADAFFLLTAFHELAGSLKITQTVDKLSSVRNALREHHATIDATATDFMALFLITRLYEMGQLTKEELEKAYVTSFASVTRSSRFGTAGAHGIAGMIRFNFFERENAFERCHETETFIVNIENMIVAVEKGLNKMLLIQGDGNYEKAQNLIENDSEMSKLLKSDIERINAMNIPVDVAFKQGPAILGIE